MKEVCDLDREVPNFAWCFDCVPEENSLYFSFGDVVFEIPSIDLVCWAIRYMDVVAMKSLAALTFLIRWEGEI